MQEIAARAQIQAKEDKQKPGLLNKVKNTLRSLRKKITGW